MTGRSFDLGAALDPATGARGARVAYDPSHLVTHGVVVGMTGSGKTGMALVLLEEALRSGVPVLAIDPKGDLGNLALTFPTLEGAAFEPWVDPAQAAQRGVSTADLAAETAARWRDGLAGWELGADDVGALKAAADVTCYTPGSTAGVPLNLLGSLSAPAGDWEAEAETLRTEVEGLTSGLLGLVGVEGDPLTSREHVLLANLIERSWRAGKDLDVGALIHQILQPPLRKLGVFELDAFFPPKDRQALAMKLNAVVASPSFEPWLQGPALDIGALLWTPEGKPRAAVVTLSHLSNEERQLVVTLLLSKVVTWMQTQAGTSELRALVYMDEVYGFAPPTAAPPSKKPILTILKQARAFGVGLVLATQNPVDLDYKAMSNAGTWLIGRLQTERDKARIVEALRDAPGAPDSGQISDLLSRLESRQFLLHDSKAPPPALIQTRWALSFLRGPLTRADLSRLKEQAGVPPAAAAPAAAPAEDALADDEAAVAPTVADGTPVYHLDPAAPWADVVDADPAGKRLEAALAMRVHLTFDEAKADLVHREEWEAVWFPLEGDFDPEALTVVDYDARDLRDEAPAGARYAIPKVKLHTKGFFRDVQRDLKKHLLRTRTVEVERNEPLELWARVGESAEAFAVRCDRAAEEAADAESAKLRERFEKKLKTLQSRLESAEAKVEQAEADAKATKQDEVLGGLGSLLGAFFGGRTTARKVATAVRGASSRRARTSKSASKVERAEAKVEQLAEEMEELEVELGEAVEEIDAKWTKLAGQVETVEVGLERTDVEVDEVAVVWVPVG